MRILILAIIGILFQAQTTNAFWDSFLEWVEDAWDSLFGETTSVDGQDNYADKCTPNDSCWPSPGEWARLRDDLQGQLLMDVKPYYDPCFQDADSQLCQERLNQTSVAYYRDDIPGSMMMPVFECNIDTAECCAIVTEEVYSQECY